MASHGDDAAPESLPPAALEGVEPGGRLADLDAFAAEVVAALEARPLQTTPLQHALAEIVSEGVVLQSGTEVTEHLRGAMALEFGVGEGNSIRTIVSVLRAGLGDGMFRVVGFDSFKGLPEDWIPEWKKGSFSQGGVPVAVDGATLRTGLFEDTVPHFFAEPSVAYTLSTMPLRLVHIDCDLYASTSTVLRCLGPALEHNTLFKGGAPLYIVFDELVDYDDYKKHEMKALHEFLLANNAYLRADVMGKDGRPTEGPPLRFYIAGEANPHSALLRLTHRLGTRTVAE